MNHLVQFPTKTFRPLRLLPPGLLCWRQVLAEAAVVVPAQVALAAAVLSQHISTTPHTIYAGNRRHITVRRLVGRGQALAPPLRVVRPPHRQLPPPPLVGTLLPCCRRGSVQGGRVQPHMKVSIGLEEKEKVGCRMFGWSLHVETTFPNGI